MCGYLELIQSSFLPFFFANIVKDELEVLARCSEINLILPAVKLIIHNFWDFFINEDKPINDVEHAFDPIELALRVDEAQRVKMVDAANFLDDEAAFNELTHLFRHFKGF